MASSQPNPARTRIDSRSQEAANAAGLDVRDLLEAVALRLIRLILLPAGILALLVFVGQIASHDTLTRSAPAFLLFVTTFSLRFLPLPIDSLAKARILMMVVYFSLACLGWQIGTFRAPGEIGLAMILIAWACLFLPRRLAMGVLLLLLASNLVFAALIHAGILVEHLNIPIGIVLIALIGVYLVLYVTVSAPIQVLFESVASSRKAEQTATEALEELRKSQNFTIQAADHSLHFFGWLSPEGMLKFANSTALRLIRSKSTDVLGLPFWDTPWFHGSSSEQQKLRDAVAQASRGETVRYETIHRSWEGALREIEFSLHPILENDGTVSMLVAEGRDVTEEHETLREKELLSERLHQSQKMEMIGQLTGGIAHDFNNSLASIGGLAQLLMEDHLDEAVKSDYLKMILEATANATSLTQRLLNFSHKASHKSTALIDIAMVVNNVATLLSRTQDKRVTVSVVSEVESAIGRGDESLLQNALLNIGINAYHAMENRGRLSFRLVGRTLDTASGALLALPVEPGEYVEIAITDTGCGMNSEVVEHIFEPFFTTKESGKGTGLGMSMVHDTLKELGGSISVDSRPGEGTTFLLYLPKAKPPLS